MIKVFFDASVLFAALYSPTGASYQLTQFVREQKILGLLSLTIIEEVEQHIDKFPEPPQISQFIIEHHFMVREHIRPHEIIRWQTMVDPTDAHVVAGAVSMGAEYLVTLDKKHLDNTEVKLNLKAVKIISPKDCLTIVRLHR